MPRPGLQSISHHSSRRCVACDDGKGKRIRSGRKYEVTEQNAKFWAPHVPEIVTLAVGQTICEKCRNHITRKMSKVAPDFTVADPPLTTPQAPATALKGTNAIKFSGVLPVSVDQAPNTPLSEQEEHVLWSLLRRKQRTQAGAGVKATPNAALTVRSQNAKGRSLSFMQVSTPSVKNPSERTLDRRRQEVGSLVQHQAGSTGIGPAIANICRLRILNAEMTDHFSKVKPASRTHIMASLQISQNKSKGLSVYLRSLGMRFDKTWDEEKAAKAARRNDTAYWNEQVTQEAKKPKKKSDPQEPPEVQDLWFSVARNICDIAARKLALLIQNGKFMHHACMDPGEVVMGILHDMGGGQYKVGMQSRNQERTGSTDFLTPIARIVHMHKKRKHGALDSRVNVERVWTAGAPGLTPLNLQVMDELHNGIAHVYDKNYVCVLPQNSPPVVATVSLEVPDQGFTGTVTVEQDEFLIFGSDFINCGRGLEYAPAPSDLVSQWVPLEQGGEIRAIETHHKEVNTLQRSLAPIQNGGQQMQAQDDYFNAKGEVSSMKQETKGHRVKRPPPALVVGSDGQLSSPQRAQKSPQQKAKHAADAI